VNAVKWLRPLIFAMALISSSPLHAVQPDEVLSDPTLEARARVLSKELRCMVCQNQSIDDSEAPLARDLRILVRERLKAGDNDKAVLDVLVARYVEFVLLQPPLSWHTVMLWGTPLAVLLAGIVGMVVALRRRRETSLATTALSDDERRKLADIIARG
jgi:cytochrome c-type biogenesis protein CcmH